jgi:hypothetical protein
VDIRYKRNAYWRIKTNGEGFIIRWAILLETSLDDELTWQLL